MADGSSRLTAAQALGSFRDSILRIVRHPANRRRRCRALIQYLTWQVWERVVGSPWTIRLGATRRIRLHPHSTVPALVLYCRIPDYEEMSFVRDYLRAGDLFVDVGANVGVYSLWASDTPGVDVLAFEPSTSTHARAIENVELNRLSERVQVHRQAVGAATGAVWLTTDLDAINHVIPDSTGIDESCEVVEQTTLDAALAGRTPTLVKIDVEGAELAVLQGGRSVILRHRPPLLVEVNDLEGLSAVLADLGYGTWRYDPEVQKLSPAGLQLRGNALALADGDVELIQARLRSVGPRGARTGRGRTYARAPMTAAPGFPPEPRSRLPGALKTAVLQHVPLIRMGLLRRDLLRRSGWTRSGRGNVPVASDGSPVPWYTYAAIHFLEGRVRSDMTVFEYGSGNSTLWWAERVAQVDAVESDPEWVARLTPSLPPNAEVTHQSAGASGSYASAASATGRRFDVIVIDGEDRAACAGACLPALKDDGVIIWDNSDWTALWGDGMRYLETSGFRRIDLRGLGPINWYEWTTSVFYRPGHNCLDL